MKLFFDLDGTLIDSRKRLYKLFQELIPQSSLSFEEYWKLKRNNIIHSELLSQYFNYKNSEILLFEKTWMTLIEDDDWLNFDKPFEGVYEYLESLKLDDNKIFIVTARHRKDNALTQISNFGWSDLFDEVLVTEQKSPKTELIKPYLKTNETNWMISDTGKDIQIGKQLNLKTAAVLTGFLNKDKLLEYNPDRIVDIVTNLKF